MSRFKLRISNQARIVQADDKTFDLEFRDENARWNKSYLGFSSLRGALERFCETVESNESDLLMELLQE